MIQYKVQNEMMFYFNIWENMKFYTKNKFSFPAKFWNLTFPLFPMNFSYI